MLSLREQQLRFAEAILDGADGIPPIGLFRPDDVESRVAIYRNNVFSNYRNALGASYPVVCRLVGKAFFDAAVDAFVRSRPSTSGDLNAYGGDFSDFLAGYPYAAGLAYLADVARLEWAIQQAQQASESERTPQEVLSALAAIDSELLPSITIGLHPSCGLIASPFPLLHIWRVNQPSFAGDQHVDLGEGCDRLLVCRDANTVRIERLDAGTFALLRSLQSANALGAAIDVAQQADPAFELGPALSAHIGAGTITFIDVEPAT